MGARRFVGILLAVTVGAGLLGSASASPDEGPIVKPGPGVQAGVAVVDLSYNVGRNQGQLGPAGNMLTGDKFDPFVHTYTQEPTDGLQARLSARALVVEGLDGERVAFLKTDHYLQQDLLFRRVAQLVEAEGIGLDADTIMMGATHNHSAPYGATTSWGVWAFADAFDLREFDYFAKGMAKAILDAAADLRPVRMGVSVGTLTEVQQNILGPTTADDGTPAGFPRDHFDPELAVLRFDDVSQGEPEPYAMLVNLAMHPESLAGNGMLSPDFVGQVEAFAERATGATVVWSQGGLGDVEPDRDARANPPEDEREYWRRDFAMQERMSRIVADRVVETWADVEAGTSSVPGKHVPFETHFEVGMVTMRFPGPLSHPVPTVSNCRTDEAARGNVGIPVVGLPDCRREGSGPDISAVHGAAKDAGVPVPDNYGTAPGTGGAQETFHAHLQVLRLGEAVLAACPCEPVTDMTLNFKTRADAAAPEMHLGYVPTCTPKDADTYACEFPRGQNWQPPEVRDVPADRYDRMVAQILNDAVGWDEESPGAVATAVSEPTDPADIKGNFTHERIQDLACGDESCGGYTVPLMVGTANDYIGYVVTYREYQRGDHYRKALTPFGPHSADYINTRLVRMAAALQGADDLAAELLQQTVEIEDVYLHARAAAVGEAAAEARAAYEAALPDDGAEPAIVLEPADREWFDAAQVRWVGGSPYTDNPYVTVLNEDGEPFATQWGGEVVVNVEYVSAQDLGNWASWAAGEHVYLWTATFETFEETPPGTYGFVIEGAHRQGGGPVPYQLESEAFEVTARTDVLTVEPSDDLVASLDRMLNATPPQITVERRASYFPRLEAEGDGTSTARFRAFYPHTYDAVGVPYLSGSYTLTGTGIHCLRCTFRPWPTEARSGSAVVTVVGSDGSEVDHVAQLDGEVWVAHGLAVGDGDTVVVKPGNLEEAGFTNAATFTFAPAE